MKCGKRLVTTGMMLALLPAFVVAKAPDPNTDHSGTPCVDFVPSPDHDPVRKVGTMVRYGLFVYRCQAQPDANPVWKSVPAPSQRQDPATLVDPIPVVEPVGPPPPAPPTPSPDAPVLATPPSVAPAAPPAPVLVTDCVRKGKAWSWKDAKGQKHYGDVPPPGCPAK